MNDIPQMRIAAAEPSSDRMFSVGVTGHRLGRLGASAVPAVADAAQVVTAAIEAAAARGHRGPATLRLVTALADGADSIVADAALTRGWVLDAVLPFPREEDARDFDGPAHAAHERQLAAARSVFELSGDRSTDEGEAKAYERAGRLVLAQCDLLVAVWDNDPSRGRGGAAQIVAEAVLLGIPVIQIDPADPARPALLWDGLQEHDLGQQTVETVARGDLSALPGLAAALLDRSSARLLPDRVRAAGRRYAPLALAYPALLAVMGVRRPRWSDFAAPDEREGIGALTRLCGEGDEEAGFARRLREVLGPRFTQADATATSLARLFRSGYVVNFGCAALAVVVSLLGLALPPGAKPYLIAVEITLIAVILILTRTGNRAGWHRRWLESRQLAEQLRCLAVSAQLGELNLRAGSTGPSAWVGRYARATALKLGLPSGQADDGYLGCCRDNLLSLIDDQVAYLGAEAHRMHALEHRLHRLGTVLFASTALICIGFLGFELALHSPFGHGFEYLKHPLVIAGTMASAALPAIGAAIYGIRMQGDFAGVAKHSETLGRHLAGLRTIIAEDTLDFDTLRRRERLVTGLLTQHLANWLETYDARPLTLPG